MKKKFSLNFLYKVTPLCILMALILLLGVSASQVHSNISENPTLSQLNHEDNDFGADGYIIQKTKDQGNFPAEEVTHTIEFGAEEEDDKKEEDYHSFDAYQGEQAHSILHYDGKLNFKASNSIHFSFQIPLYILFHSWRVFIA